MTDVVKCPYCDFVSRGVNGRRSEVIEIQHMNEYHPDVIEKRLTDSGFRRDESGNWFDTLADPDN